jgi:thiamine kinase-like enzyme
LDIAARQQEAREILSQCAVISHGDLDQKNVLWSAGGEPILIDWESARRMNPTHEAILVALDWSGITTGFEFPLFEKFMTAYRHAGGLVDNDALQSAFDCVQGDWLNWLMFNVGRSFDLEDTERRSLGAEQVDLALSTLLRLDRLMPKLVFSAGKRSEMSDV